MNGDTSPARASRSSQTWRPRSRPSTSDVQEPVLAAPACTASMLLIARPPPGAARLQPAPCDCRQHLGRPRTVGRAQDRKQEVRKCLHACGPTEAGNDPNDRSPPLQHIGRGLQESRSEEHTSELQSPCNLVCRLLLEKKKKTCKN